MGVGCVVGIYYININCVRNVILNQRYHPCKTSFACPVFSMSCPLRILGRIFITDEHRVNIADLHGWVDIVAHDSILSLYISTSSQLQPQSDLVMRYMCLTQRCPSCLPFWCALRDCFCTWTIVFKPLETIQPYLIFY